MSDAETSNRPSREALGSVLFEDVLERFVRPEVKRRHDAGEIQTGTEVYRFQILFHPEQEVEIRLNEQVGGTAEFIATRALEAGEEITTGDVSGISSFEPLPEDEGIPHTVGFLHRDGWSLVSRFDYRHPRRFEHLHAGSEFAQTAREAFAAGRLGVALDNAYSAVELLAKTELLSCHPTISEALKSQTHGGVATPYSLWARLENTDRRFVKLLYRLQELRPAGRYLNKQLDLEDGEANVLFELLDEMEEHVRATAEEDPETARPEGFNVIATRDLKAGQLVMGSDYTLRPPKKRVSIEPPAESQDG